MNPLHLTLRGKAYQSFGAAFAHRFMPSFLLVAFFIFLFSSSALAGEKADKFKPVVYKTRTEDGWDIVLKRFKGANVSTKKAPVILCHGFNYNDEFWHLDKKLSLVYYLFTRGYDVWLLSLRGSGDSTKSGLAELRSLSKLNLLKMPETLARAALSLNKLNWNIDDHINKDIPVAMALVKKETGHEAVNWIGHSLGGMIMYAYLGGGGEGINSFISIASPMIIPQPPNDLLTMIRDQPAALYLSLVINSAVASQFKAAGVDLMKSPFDLLFYNTANMEKDIIIKMYRQAVEDIAPGVIDQLRVMIANGEFLSADKKINYSANLSGINVPILCLGGLDDNMAHVMSIHYAYEKVSSSDKSMRIFCLANGYSANYGHNDLLLGKKAPDEVYPYILKWLEHRGTK